MTDFIKLTIINVDTGIDCLFKVKKTMINEFLLIKPRKNTKQFTFSIQMRSMDI